MTSRFVPFRSGAFGPEVKFFGDGVVAGTVVAAFITVVVVG
jgi:hypothetical protein